MKHRQEAVQIGPPLPQRCPKAVAAPGHDHQHSSLPERHVIGARSLAGTRCHHAPTGRLIEHGHRRKR